MYAKDHTHHIHTQRGQAVLFSVVAFMFIALAVLFAFIVPVVQGARLAENKRDSLLSIVTAESVMEDVLYREKNGMTLAYPETLSLNGGSAQADALVLGGSGKEITVEGDVDARIRKLRAQLTVSVGATFSFGAQVGEGGMVMLPNSHVRGAGLTPGNVYSNGSVVGANNSSVTGDLTVAGTIVEDNQARSTVCNTDNNVGQIAPEIDFAQSFVGNGSGVLGKVSLYVKEVGNPGSRPVRIVPDNAGSPGTSEVVSGTLNSTLVGSSYAWIDVAFTSPPTLVDGQTYWVVLDAVEKDNKYFIWCSDSNNGYGNGVAKYKGDWSSAGTWTSITGDLAFKTYIGQGESVIEDMTVGGDARANTIRGGTTVGGDAYYQTLEIPPGDVTGTLNPGSPDPAPMPLPISDANIEDMRAAAAAGGTVVGDCVITDTTVTGPCARTMGPLKIDGNLTVQNGADEDKKVVLTGTIYVTGNVIFDNNADAACDPLFGSDECAIIADGYIHAHNNVDLFGSGDANSYMMLLTAIEGCNGGVQQPQCGNNNSGMWLDNNVKGGIFYASKSQIHISNGVDTVAAFANKLSLDNNAVITYEIGVLNSNFSSGPGGGWAVDSWQEVE